MGVYSLQNIKFRHHSRCVPIVLRALSALTSCTAAALYAVFFHDFGNHEHVFQPVSIYAFVPGILVLMSFLSLGDGLKNTYRFIPLLRM
jgi:hypothetical protein